MKFAWARTGKRTPFEMRVSDELAVLTFKGTPNAMIKIPGVPRYFRVLRI